MRPTSLLRAQLETSSARILAANSSAPMEHSSGALEALSLRRQGALRPASRSTTAPSPSSPTRSRTRAPSPSSTASRRSETRRYRSGAARHKAREARTGPSWLAYRSTRASRVPDPGPASRTGLTPATSQQRERPQRRPRRPPRTSLDRLGVGVEALALPGQSESVVALQIVVAVGLDQSRSPPVADIVGARPCAPR
jgi:hypothetical protein